MEYYRPVSLLFIHHKSLNTLLKPSLKSYPEILQVLKYFNNQNQIMKKHFKHMQPNLQQNNTKKRTRKIIWFNPPVSLNVKTNMAEMLLQLIDTHFLQQTSYIKSLTVRPLKLVTAAIKIYCKL